MAQSLDNRINAALRSAARLKDVETVICDVKAEIAATTVKFDGETARSVDPSLTTPQAREARNNAADLEHDIRRLNASLSLLEEKRAKLIEDAKEAERRSEYDSAKAERDDLAALIRTRYPALALELVNIVQRIDASNAQVKAANYCLPDHAKPLIPAEDIARGHIGYSWNSGGPIHKLGDIILPLLHTAGAYLPIQRNITTGRKDHWERQIAEEQKFSATPLPDDCRPGAALEPAHG